MTKVDLTALPEILGTLFCTLLQRTFSCVCCVLCSIGPERVRELAGNEQRPDVVDKREMGSLNSTILSMVGGRYHHMGESESRRF